MQSIVITLVNVFTKLGDWYSDRWEDTIELIVLVWDSSMLVIDMIGIFWMDLVEFFWQFWQDIFLLLARFGLDILMVIPELAVSVLPDMPDSPDSISIAAAANVYLPVVEAAALTATWGTVFGLIGSYKLAKFVRGGG